MPELTEIQIDDIPAPPSEVPLRQGEEKYSGALNLEHSRRMESEVEALRAEVAKLQNMAAPMKKHQDGLSARRRRALIAAKVSELKAATTRDGDRWKGPCAPATLLNFNPVKLFLQGELSDQTVPAAGNGKTVKIPYNGRTFVASYVTFSNPKIWPVIIGTENLEGFDASSIRPDYISPVGIAYQFYSHYVTGAMDALGMGGIVIFEGDIHTLEKKKQERSGGKILVPRIDPLMSTRDMAAYASDEVLFLDALKDTLTRQKTYAEMVIAEGHGFATSQADDIRKQLTKYHVLWHNFAMDMKYKTEPESWASDRLHDDPNVAAVHCPDCHTRQSSPEQFFCANCNAPFDALKAFLAGKVVSMDRLEVYEGEDWKKIVTEQSRRRAKRALLEGEPEKKSKS